ncbi:MAG: fumarylacetoacetate hydrolase family protein [Bacteroidota bacterium]
MKFQQFVNAEKRKVIAVEIGNSWRKVESEESLLNLLGKEESELKKLVSEEIDLSTLNPVMPFSPAAYRDFMLYEKHAIDAARGFVRKYLPKLFPIVNTYEKLTGNTFPKLKPKKRYYQYPIYYLGNHLNFISHHDPISIPSYSRELDYELELAAVITKPLKNASPAEVSEAIGGFMILNDFSARDVQMDEVESGFGPMKTKNFGSSISSVVVSAGEILPKLEDLSCKVRINEKLISEGNTRGMKYSMQEAIAYASMEEQLHPGEIFGSGTIPGCTGIENGRMLNKGDSITLIVKGIGELTNTVV